jgi:hypothetical protein
MVLVALFAVAVDVLGMSANSHRGSSERHQQYCHTGYRKNQLDAYQYAPPLTGNPQWIAIVADSGTKTGIKQQDLAPTRKQAASTLRTTSATTAPEVPLYHRASLG